MAKEGAVYDLFRRNLICGFDKFFYFPTADTSIFRSKYYKTPFQNPIGFNIFRVTILLQPFLFWIGTSVNYRYRQIGWRQPSIGSNAIESICYKARVQRIVKFRLK